MIYWYVLFVKTGKEHKLETFIKERDTRHVLAPFVPMLETFFKKNGVVQKEIEPLFPGYLFIETELNPIEFLYTIKPLLSGRYRNADIIKVLSYGAPPGGAGNMQFPDVDVLADIALREDERQALLLLCNTDYAIETSIGIAVGDRICITEGPLAGRESIIKKIDRHKMQALIELPFMGTMRQVKVALRVVEKV